MSRTSHRWHVEVCPHCGQGEQVQNRSYRYVAPDSTVVSGRPHYISGYNLHSKRWHWVGDTMYRPGEFRRTTQHRLACARKHGIPAYES